MHIDRIVPLAASAVAILAMFAFGLPSDIGLIAIIGHVLIIVASVVGTPKSPMSKNCRLTVIISGVCVAALILLVMGVAHDWRRFAESNALVLQPICGAIAAGFAAAWWSKWDAVAAGNDKPDAT